MVIGISEVVIFSYLQANDSLENGFINAAYVLLIGLGVTVILIASIGFFGAMLHNKCMLLSFIIIANAVLIMEVSLMVFIFFGALDLGKMLSNHTQLDVINAISKIRDIPIAVNLSNYSFAFIFKHKLNCCVKNTAQDEIILPDFCCKNYCVECGIFSRHGLNHLNQTYKNAIRTEFCDVDLKFPGYYIKRIFFYLAMVSIILQLICIASASIIILNESTVIKEPTPRRSILKSS